MRKVKEKKETEYRIQETGDIEGDRIQYTGESLE